MRHLDLFSGIGGFALAAEWIGWTTIAFCEIDPYCQAVLRKRFPGVPIYGDIRETTGIPANARCVGSEGAGIETGGIEEHSDGTQERRKVLLPPADIITGGFPCQPFSQAGVRRGPEDDRDLWPEMLRTISEIRPRWVVAENVPGIGTMEFADSIPEMDDEACDQEGGANEYTTYLDGICGSLEAIGYEVQPVVIPAAGVGAPHRRDRIFFIGYNPNSIRNATGRTYGEKCGCGQQGWKNKNCVGRDEMGGDPANICEDVADPDRSGFRKHSGAEPVQEEHAPAECGSAYEGRDVANTEVGTVRPGLCEEFKGGFRRGRLGNGSSEIGWCEWEPEPRILRVSNGVPNRVDRIRSLGNAVLPQVVYEVYRAIEEAERIVNMEKEG